MGLMKSLYMEHLDRQERAKELAEEQPSLVLVAPEMLKVLKDAERHCGVIALDVVRSLIARAEEQDGGAAPVR